jgi:hypothetical protein
LTFTCGRMLSVQTKKCSFVDYVKVELSDHATGIGEWMWVCVERCDEQYRLVFGTLDNEPLNDYSGKVKLGSELAVSYDEIGGHKTAAEFRSKSPTPPGWDYSPA